MATQRNSKEHPSLFTRRDFLCRTCLGAAVSYTIPSFLQSTFMSFNALAAESAVQVATGKDSPILVLVQLAGGNDGLNALVPYADDAYYSARPRIGIPKGDVLSLNDYVGFNKVLQPLKGIYDQGHLGVIQGVGYPNPNRSHFRSTEIWQTAVDSEKTLSTGWLGRYFDNQCAGAAEPDPMAGMAVGNETPLAMVGKTPSSVTLSRPENYRFQTGARGEDGQRKEGVYRELNQPKEMMGDSEFVGGSTEAGASIGTLGGAGMALAPGEDSLDFLQRVALDAQLSSDKITEIAKKYPTTAAYPTNNLANSLHLVARMIAGGMSTRVYYVSQGGFDTHQGQTNTHNRLLTDLGESLAAFHEDIKAQGKLDQVLVMTFSEFGRRVAENGSGGTDHGTAAPMFMMGAGVKAGVYGTAPSLTTLDKGDLIHTVDFRSVYASVLEHWMKTPSAPILGRKFPLLGVV